MALAYYVPVEYFSKIFTPYMQLISIFFKGLCVFGSFMKLSVCVYAVNEKTSAYVSVVHVTLALIVYLAIIRLLAVTSENHSCTRTERSRGHRHTRYFHGRFWSTWVKKGSRIVFDF